jgi:hypothetical protein
MIARPILKKSGLEKDYLEMVHGCEEIFLTIAINCDNFIVIYQ